MLDRLSITKRALLPGSSRREDSSSANFLTFDEHNFAPITGYL